MDFLQIIILALIQGITEFLPISSSGHLVLPAQLLDWQDQGNAFDVAVHVGTLLAVCIYFWSDIKALWLGWTASLIKKQPSHEATLSWCIIWATLPALLFGGVLSLLGWDEKLRSTLVIATTTIVFGLLLWQSELKGKKTRELTEMTIYLALLIGFAQALALIPGTSRSGITITIALFLGFNRSAAARFSFLLSIPVILAAGTLKILQLVAAAEPVAWDVLIYGAVIAGVSAFLCIHWFLGFINRIGLLPFVIYRLLLGIVLFCLYFAVEF
ncbi:undecaprenyl-diphosphate phosphatase [Endozoicomonas sp. SM1973]|uniref:Undecaprenyl-diphosphatase n=1 Tax=Spartinivicinus marinus TaxID=2994442 RepID=A0A853I5S0_9GAMM|nr:undecaprenyl-diphosphate phosphatase [Spartinivicinus marinus]MCX4025480.1 undecaprenyl-diphosphate phosphatase [Spartinivicinus marinus]NYZ65291.1 undecaprenyl-diphosphate phosphatase [Spartinivicinus marinus]